MQRSTTSWGLWLEMNEMMHEMTHAPADITDIEFTILIAKT
jgi:hypothetical protein